MKNGNRKIIAIHFPFIEQRILPFILMVMILDTTQVIFAE